MLSVELDKIIPLTEARDSLSKIIAEVENNEEMYVLTKGGKPSVAIVSIPYLETLTGEKVEDKIRNIDESSEPIEEQQLSGSTTWSESKQESMPEPEPMSEAVMAEETAPVNQPVETKPEEEIPATLPDQVKDLTAKFENEEMTPVQEIKEETQPVSVSESTQPNPGITKNNEPNEPEEMEIG